MNITKIGLLCLSASMIGAGALALNGSNVKEVKAENESNLILNHNQEKFLNIFAKKMHQDKSDYYAYLDNWLSNPTETKGLNYFNDFDTERTEFYTTDVEAAKNSVYFDTLLVSYMFERDANIDMYRIMLDHFMPLKESMNALSEYLSYEVIEEKTEVAKDVCFIANDIYAGLKETYLAMFDLPEDEAVVPAFTEFRNYLKTQSDYLRNNADITVNPFTTYLNIAKATNTITHLDLTLLEDTADSFIQNYVNVNDSHEFLDYDSSDLDTWLADEETYHDQIMSHFDLSLNTLFYYFKTIQYMELVCPDNFNGFAVVINNIGPSMYKMLDLIEAIRGDEETHTPDYPNVLILSLETADDTKTLLDLFNDQVAEVIKTDINKFAALETTEYISWKDAQIAKTNNAVALFNAALDEYEEKGEFEKAYKAIDNIEKVCKELSNELTNKRDELKFFSQDMEFILRKINELSLKCFTFRKDVEYDEEYAKIDALGDVYADLANTEVDSIATYDVLDEELLKIWMQLYHVLAETNALYEKYGESKFNELLIDAYIFYAQTLDTILEKHDDVMHLIDNEINVILDNVNGKANLIYSLKDKDGADVSELIKEAVALTNELDNVVITLGHYEEHFGSESTLDDLSLKEELEYAKVTTLIANLRDLQKELAIESLVLRGTDFTDKTNNLIENEGSIKECDALIEEINALITEIDDNAEALGQDERLAQTKTKLNENVSDINEYKESVNSKHNRNIAIIVSSSVVGAALLFVGGFFTSKVLSRKYKKESD